MRLTSALAISAIPAARPTASIATIRIRLFDAVGRPLSDDSAITCFNDVEIGIGPAPEEDGCISANKIKYDTNHIFAVN